MAASESINYGGWGLVLTLLYCLVFVSGLAFVGWGLLSKRYFAASCCGAAMAFAIGLIWNESLFGEAFLDTALRLAFQGLGMEEAVSSTYAPPIRWNGMQVAEAMVVAGCAALGLALSLAIWFYQSYRYRHWQQLADQADLGDSGYRLHLKPTPKVFVTDEPPPSVKELAVLEPGISLEERVGMQLFLQQEQRTAQIRPAAAATKPYRPRFSPPLSRSNKAS